MGKLHVQRRRQVQKINGWVQMTVGNSADTRDELVNHAERLRHGWEHAIGETVSTDVINSICEAVKSAKPHPAYKEHADIPFIYEILDFEGWDSIVLPLAIAWIENPANFKRATSVVNRSPSSTIPEELLCARCVFRLKERETKEWKISKEDGLQVHLDHPETIVFLATEDLGPENGFFIPLKRGQDVCVDGRANISFPATGGGRGISFVFRI